MRFFLVLSITLAIVPATASQPVGKAHGSWLVVSISSLSGTEGNDASLSLTQGEESDTIEVRWTEGGPVVVSMNIDKCSGEEDFEAFYSVEVDRWLRLSDDEVQNRLQADFATWLDQAKLACGSHAPATMFKMRKLKAAAADFNDRLRSFAGI